MTTVPHTLDLTLFLAEPVNSGLRLVLTTHSDFFVTQSNNMMRLAELSVCELINLQRDGHHAKPYQVRQVRQTILRIIYWSDQDGMLVAEVPELSIAANFVALRDFVG